VSDTESGDAFSKPFLGHGDSNDEDEVFNITSSDSTGSVSIKQIVQTAQRSLPLKAQQRRFKMPPSERRRGFTLALWEWSAQ